MGDINALRAHANELLDVLDTQNNLINALQELVDIIDKAGLQNLSNGVQIGQMSWYVKANDRLVYAKNVLNSTSHT